MESITQTLKQNPAFSVLSDEEFPLWEEMMEKKSVRAGDILTTAGDPATFFFVLISGSLLAALPEGRAIVMDTPGDLIGLELLSRRGRYISEVTALTAGALLACPRTLFLEKIQADTPGAARFMAAWDTHVSDRYPFITLTPTDTRKEYQY